MAINTLFKNIADAIRAKTGGAGLLTPAQMPSAIAGIPGNPFDLPDDIETLVNTYFKSIYAPSYIIGSLYEYLNYISDTFISNNNLDALLTYNGNSGTGNQIINGNLSDYRALITQGAYYNQRTSQYNTSVLYPLSWYIPNDGIYHGKNLWAGMKDRNSSYDVNFSIVNDNTINIVSRGTANAGMFLYGLP